MRRLLMVMVVMLVMLGFSGSSALASHTPFMTIDVAEIAAITVPGIVPQPYELGTYVSGGFGVTGTSPPDAWAYTLDPAFDPSAADSLDYHWIQGRTLGIAEPIIWDLGIPSDSVLVFPSIDHGPMSPAPYEALEFTVWGSNDPAAMFPESWSLATLSIVYADGWTDVGAAQESDDFASLWAFEGGAFQFVIVYANRSIQITPGTASENSCLGEGVWCSLDHEVDAVGRPIVQDFPITGYHANEPFLAINPNNADHIVVVFNDLRNSPQVGCGWAESTDGGRTWEDDGQLPLPSGFVSQGDPWVRFGPDGELIYTCIAKTEDKLETRGLRVTQVWENGIMVSVSQTGFARDLPQAKSITLVPRSCVLSLRRLPRFLECKDVEGQFVDRPSIAVLERANAPTQYVACWISDITGDTRSRDVMVSTSDDGGNSWSHERLIATHLVNACAVGGGEGAIAVSWLDGRDGTLKLRTWDGQRWFPPVTLAHVGDLVFDKVVDDRISTTDKVLSVPYSLVVSKGVSSLRAFYQVRLEGRSQVFVADSDNNWERTPIDNSGFETFLPGAGTCSNFVGMYQEAEDEDQRFLYTLWSVTGTREAERILRSEVTNIGGDNDPRFELPRIGEYTGADCHGSFGLAAWTDTRSGEPRIWGATTTLP